MCVRMDEKCIGMTTLLFPFIVFAYSLLLRKYDDEIIKFQE